MRDFLISSLMFQQMAVKTAASMTSLMMKTQQRLIDQQFALLTQMQTARRSDDSSNVPANPQVRKQRAQKTTGQKRKDPKHRSPCCGPDLLDHYGKRAHDVDVEHI